jgi:hypothetical protein
MPGVLTSQFVLETAFQPGIMAALESASALNAADAIKPNNNIAEARRSVGVMGSPVFHAPE